MLHDHDVYIRFHPLKGIGMGTGLPEAHTVVMRSEGGNRLKGSTSPYLLQHADNPVAWFGWGDDALEEARARDVPIFLSVGYAACHWCHVMERESFVDEGTARYLNDHFVSIKVDREERPDVDGLYMGAVQAMTGSGGWPMSVFLTPAGAPFYAGTYFPDTPRHGMPSFRQVLEGIVDAWTTRRAEVETQGGEVAAAIAAAAAAAARPIDADVGDRALVVLRAEADDEWGGFGGAPKFPQPMILGWLLRQDARGGIGLLPIVERALDRMADGGIHDQVGGGFARYSTDRMWHVPHFEKMLTDNAQLLQVYVDAWVVTGYERHRDVAVRIADYLLRDLQLSSGGFATSEDADSEGVEGTFYVWHWDELVDLVGATTAELLGARPEGNWEGRNILWFPAGLGDAQRHEVAAARATLASARAGRTRPALDDKVIAGWNGLAIRALAHAGRSLGVPAYIEAAGAAARFVWDRMRNAEGRLLRSWRDGRAGIPAFLDDHALLGLGLLELYSVTGNVAWFRSAAILANQILERFTDGEGGLYLTADDAETLLVRPREQLDNAVPSGNAAAAELLVRIGLYTGERRFEEAAEDAIAPMLTAAGRHPTAFGHTLCVADMLVGPTAEIAIVGGRTEDRDALDAELAARFLPNAIVALSGTAETDALDVPLLRDRVAVNGLASAYVCQRFVCRAPVTDPAALRASLP